jgi:deoxyribodipyrimidine photo-lyase
MMAHWQVGEQAALERLYAFLETTAMDYKTARDQPAIRGTSRLSPHLHFGEISPRQIAYLAQQYLADHPEASVGIQHFLQELAWREFAWYLLFHFPHTVTEPLDQRFKSFQWQDNYQAELKRWQQGRTGIPIVDAGMRELWQTGWMHNRVRMIAASLLTKNLLIPWQVGEAWFRDTLVDADLANNVLGWQWVAGSGADAAPYFRIFNPILQGEKFDPNGDYVRRWVPELAGRAAKEIHHPRVLGDGWNYLLPITDLAASRQRALERYAQMRA